MSQATNLFVPDTNGNKPDAFIRNHQTGVTQLASINSKGQQVIGFDLIAHVSATGRYVAFDTLNLPGGYGGNQVYLHDTQTGTTDLVTASYKGDSGSDGNCHLGHVSPDGRFISFFSYGSNLVAEPYFPPQCFLRDRQTGETHLVSIGSTGEPWQGSLYVGGISDDGRFIAIRGHDSSVPSLSYSKVYVRDRLLNQTILASAGPNGEFPNGHTFDWPRISGNGRYVYFTDYATNLVENDSNGKGDAFVRDLVLEQTIRISVSSKGEQANGDSFAESISGNGRFIAFSSYADNLVPGDANGFADGFVHDLWTGTTELVTLNWQGEQINNHAGMAGISDDGRAIGFVTYANNVIQQPVNEFLALYVRARWKLGDVNRDGVVNVVDLLAIINAWGPCPAPPPPPALPIPCDADVTNDNTVNVVDLLLIINNWG